MIDEPEMCSALRPASRMAGLELSKILQVTDRANALKAAGRPVIVLGAGEPDFDTPEHIKAAARDAIDLGATKYTISSGTLALKDAIRRKFARENGLAFERSEVMASAGAKQVIYNAMAATLDPGDEVVLIAPLWTSYFDIVRICGGRPMVVETSDASGFRVDPAVLARAITPRTRWVILNAPSNPAGVMYGPDDLRRLCAVLLDNPHVWILSDDIYEHIIYEGRSFLTAASVEPRLRNRSLTVNGVSKAYAMTGWRIGYAGGPAPLITAMTTVQGQINSCAASMAQVAAIAALDGPQDLLAERTALFQVRRDFVVSSINSVPGLRCQAPEGAFYLFVNCSGWLGCVTPAGRVLETDEDVCEYLLEDHDVAVVPGAAFWLSPYFRISFAAALEELQTACARIAAAGARLS